MGGGGPAPSRRTSHFRPPKTRKPPSELPRGRSSLEAASEPERWALVSAGPGRERAGFSAFALGCKGPDSQRTERNVVTWETAEAQGDTWMGFPQPFPDAGSSWWRGREEAGLPVAI